MDAIDSTTFQYLKPTDAQLAVMATMRNSFAEVADDLVRLVPDGPDKDTALRKLREAAMWVNVTITRHPDGSARA